MSDRIELVLYVLSESAPCQRAQAMMHTILDRFDAAAVDFRVCDLTAEPASAEIDGIVVTPTLIKRSPPPTVWIIGDLSKAEVVVELLEGCGVAPRSA